MRLYILATLAIALPSVHSFLETSSIDSRSLWEHVLLRRVSPERSGHPATDPKQQKQNLPLRDQAVREHKVSPGIASSGDKASAPSTPSIKETHGRLGSKVRTPKEIHPLNHSSSPPSNIADRRFQAKVKAHIAGPARVDAWTDRADIETHNIDQDQYWRGFIRNGKAANMLITTYEGNPPGSVNFSAKGYQNAYGFMHTSTGTGQVQRIDPHLRPVRHVPPDHILAQESTGHNQKQKIRGILQGPGQVFGTGRNPAYHDVD